MSKKILILSDDYPPQNGGGAAIVAETHAIALEKKGFDVVVVTTVPDKSSVGESIINNIRIIKLYSKYNKIFRAYISLYNPFLVSKLANIFKKEKPDIIHAHNIHYHLSYHSLVLARRYAKSVFITIHDSMPFHYSKYFPKAPYEILIKSYEVSYLRQIKHFKLWFNPFRNILIRYYLSIPNKIFAVSSALKNALEDNGITNIEVVYNGIDINLWDSDQVKLEEFKQKNNLENKKVIMFCGRLSNAKGGKVILKILPFIIKAIPNAVLLVVGEKDIAAQKMLEFAHRLNIDHAVIFTGRLGRNVIKYAYKASNLLVVPSLCFDWFPTVNLEAMASKIPVIASCFGGSSELVSDGETGYVRNPYNEKQFMELIIKILDNDLLQQKLGHAGYERVRTMFTMENNIDKIISWYNKI